MKSAYSRAGRRATQLVPGLAHRPIAVAAAAPQPALSDDLKLFLMTLLGGIVFFGTFLG
ncbi:MAG TPA: hypothetical protein VNT25_03725 [Allosphingosinicella sp.]|nr:hypothetical protein [Allosphingosinicella sp.]